MICTRKWTYGLALTALTGCAGMTQAYWSAGQRWGCDPELTRMASAEYHKDVRGIFVYTPQPGWHVCELLARTGMPSDATMVADRDSESQHLYYRANTSRGGGLVVLERAPRGWLVESVVWDQ